MATPPEKAQLLRDQIPDSKLVIIANSAHSSPIEKPEAVTEALEAFLVRQLSGLEVA